MHEHFGKILGELMSHPRMKISGPICGPIADIRMVLLLNHAREENSEIVVSSCARTIPWTENVLRRRLLS